jgi:AraC-like DNA-binding protein
MEESLTDESHSATFAYARKAQMLGLVWLDPDPVRRLPQVWDVLREIPRCHRDTDRVVLAIIVRRIAEAFFKTQRRLDLTPEARLHRKSVQDVHTVRALEYVCREFANCNISVRGIAAKCQLSPPYVSHLITTNTRYSCREHLGAIRVLHAAYALATSALSVKEVANHSGYRHTAALDHEFQKRFFMTPGEFRRWAT